MVLNSLGGVFQRQMKFDDAFNALLLSIEIGEKLNDKRHLAMVHTSMGNALVSKGDIENAVAELIKSFEINEELKNRHGIGVVATTLIKTLLQLNQWEQAISYCQRALSIAPNDRRLLKLYEQLTES